MTPVSFSGLFIAIVTALKAIDAYLTYYITRNEEFQEMNAFVNLDGFWNIFFSPIPFAVFSAAIFSFLASVILSNCFSRIILDKHNKKRSAKYVSRLAELMRFGFLFGFVISLAVINNSIIYLSGYAILNESSTKFIDDNTVISLIFLLIIIVFIDRKLAGLCRYIIRNLRYSSVS